MKSSNELLISTDPEKFAADTQPTIQDDKPDWFQQIHNGVESVHVPGHHAEPATIDRAHSAMPMWREIALFALALLLIFYSYYTAN